MTVSKKIYLVLGFYTQPKLKQNVLLFPLWYYTTIVKILLAESILGYTKRTRFLLTCGFHRSPFRYLFFDKKKYTPNLSKQQNPIPCWKPEKSYEPILRKIGNRRTDGQTDGTCLKRYDSSAKRESKIINKRRTLVSAYHLYFLRCLITVAAGFTLK